MAEAPTELPPTVSKLTLMIIVWLGVLIATTAVAIRAFIRLKYRGRLQLDDVFTAFALALLVASAVMYTVAVDPLITLALVGSGLLYPPPADFVNTSELYLRLQFAITLAFWTCLWTVKASFLTLFYPLSNGLRVDRILWYLVVVFVSVAYIACVISYPISCDNFILGGCETPRNVQLSLVSLRMSTAIDIISDAFIILLPWKLLWVVQRSVREKMAIGSIVGLGLVIIVFAIIRIIVTNVTHTHPEPVWLALWSAMETTVAVVVISLTSLKVLFNKANNSASSSSAAYGSRSNHYAARFSGKNDDESRSSGGIPLADTGKQQGLQSYHLEVGKASSTSNESPRNPCPMISLSCKMG